MRPNIQGLSGGEPSVGDYLSWSAIGSSGTDPPGALFKAEEAVCGPSDCLVHGQVGTMGVVETSSASPSADETTVLLVKCEGLDDESNDSEEANLRQMLLMELAGKRKETQSTTAQVNIQNLQSKCLISVYASYFSWQIFTGSKKINNYSTILCVLVYVCMSASEGLFDVL